MAVNQTNLFALVIPPNAIRFTILTMHQFVFADEPEFVHRCGD